MTARIHHVEQHRSSVPGIELMTLVTNHQFPRHSHDQFAVGVIDCGNQRSWSRIGTVYASAGDVITANPGEMHDGIPLEGKARQWRMIYFEPRLVYREIEQEIAGEIEIVCPVVRDSILSERFRALFSSLV